MNMHPRIPAFLQKSLELSKETPMDIIPMPIRGSNRVFFRIQSPFRDSVILVHYDRVRQENAYFASIAGFLRKIGVAVPRIIAHDSEECLLLVEDLGDIDLRSYQEAPWETRSSYYRKTLQMVQRLHAFPVKDFPSRDVPLMEPFGPALYRWERDYFRENFVEAVCDISLVTSDHEALEAELSALAERLDHHEPCLVHRDLQSQNVMISRDETVFIDFQGMRFGSPFYDLGSLLCDPYVPFTEDERLELLHYYFLLSGGAREWKVFRKAFWDASTQRLMQALGAYGFLGLKRDHPEFLIHIPGGLDCLLEVATRAADLPCLKKLAIQCQIQISLQQKIFL